MSSLTSSTTNDISPWHVADVIFVSLMQNGYDEVSKSNRYIIQLINKFKYFRINSKGKCFEISFKDLNSETIDLIAEYTKDCKDPDEKYEKLDGVFVEVIARIIKQAEPAILSSYSDESRRVLAKVVLNEIREIISHKWKMVGGDINLE